MKREEPARARPSGQKDSTTKARLDGRTDRLDGRIAHVIGKGLPDSEGRTLNAE